MTPWSILQLILAGSISVLLLAGVVLLVWWFDRYDREPLGLVAVVFGWGAAGASVAAILFERRLVEVAMAWLVRGGGSMAASAVVAVVFEEILKAAGVVAVAVLSERFDNPTDGIVYGTAVGLGFAVTENFVYGTALAVAGAAGAGALVVLLRTASAALLHGLASGVFGALLGVGYLSRSWPRRLGWSAIGLAAAVAVHASWNLSLHHFPTPSLLPWLMAAPVLLLLWIGLLQLMLLAEQRILVRELTDEVRLGVLPGWVAEVVPSFRRRIRSDWWPDRAERAVISRLLTRLAFRKHAVGRLPAKEATLAGLEVVTLRRRAREALGLTMSRTAD